MPDPIGFLNLNARGVEVQDLHSKLLRLGVALPVREVAEQEFGAVTLEAVKRVQANLDLPATGVLDDATKQAIDGAVGNAASAAGTLQGRIYLDRGEAAAGVKVRVYGTSFGGQETVLREGVTDENGFYSLAYTPPTGASSVDLRAVGDDGAEHRLSEPLVDVASNVTVNLVAPGAVRVQLAEYQRLAGDVAAQLSDLGQLGNAQETGERRDLSLLHEATGWDARLLALAARAEQVTDGTGIPGKALYALFRAGLPTEPFLLAGYGADDIEQALTQAQASGIVAFAGTELADAKGAFTSFAATTRLAAKAPDAVSTTAELLRSAGLDDVQHAIFSGVVLNHQGTDEQLWAEAAAKGLAEPTVQKLQTQGKLAFLTRNHAPLAAALQAELGDGDLSGLVTKLDLHRPEKWRDRLQAVAGVATDAQAAFADEASRKVRITFPTQVVARLVETDELTLGDQHEALKEPVTTFLSRAVGHGFRLGATPVQAFIRDHGAEVFAGLPKETVDVATDGVRRLQRLYQISPSDGSLKTLYDCGFQGARDVVALPLRKFLDRFGARFPSRDEATLVYRKSQQVTAVTLNFFTGLRRIDSTPRMVATSAPADQGEATLAGVKQNLIEAYPTLETVFGSLDFCACEHCRSVLSPAAYLVDLLKFLDVDQTAWQATVEDFNKTHEQPYPGGQATPYDILVSRRPDLPNLALTCENTNTALPYIDIVNEILEYWVAHSGLDDKSVRDTRDETTAELLAEPVNVVEEAYTVLAGANATYPLVLPFDLWTESARAFLDASDTPFWQVLDALRTIDELDAPAGSPAGAYGRGAVFTEYLGLTPAEVALFTGADSLIRWYRLYGYPDEQAALGQLTSAKAIARRLGVDYADLTDLVRTAVVNPHLDALVLLRRLRLEVDDIALAKAHADLLDRDLSTLSADERALRLTVEAVGTRLADASAEAGMDLSATVAGWWADGTLDKILLLWADSPTADFGTVKLQYTDHLTPATPADLFNLNLFVRLRAKLGWSTEELDRALVTFLPYPASGAPLDAAWWATAWRTALVGLAHLKDVQERLGGDDARLQLLTLWGDLTVTGRNPLYAQLFLTRGVLGADPAWDHPLGLYLSDPNEMVAGHLPAIRSALRLTGEEVTLVLASATLDPETAKLTMQNVSLLCRHAILARAMKVSVRDLIALKTLTGVDPFTPVAGPPMGGIGDDHALHTLEFLRIWALVRDHDLSIADVRYLVLQDIDPDGPYQPDTAALASFVRTLAGEIGRIRADHAVPVDLTAVTDDRIRQELALVVPQDAVDAFFRLWTGTTTAGAAQFFADYLQVSAAPAGDGGFLLPGDLATVFPDPVPTDDHERRHRLAETLLPFVQRRLVRAFVAATVGPTSSLDADMTEALLTDVALLTDPTVTSAPLLDGFVDAATTGVTLTYYDSVDGSGPERANTAAGPPDTAVTAAGAPPSAHSVRVKGHVEVPTSGTYRLIVALGKAGCAAELYLTGLADPVVAGTAAADGDRIDGTATLKAGTLYQFTLWCRNTSGGAVRMEAAGPNLPAGPLERLRLYPQAAVDRVRRAQTRFAKTAQLVTTLGLTEREVRHVRAYPADFAAFDPNALPVDPVDVAAHQGGAPGFLTPLCGLLTYARLRTQLAGGTDGLVDVFERARRRTALLDAGAQAALATAMVTEVCAALAALTRRDPATVTALAGLFAVAAVVAEEAADHRITDVPGIRRVDQLATLREGLRLVARIGVPAKDLIGWITPKPTAEAARGLRAAVKGRYDPDTWLRVVQPISDRLRRRRRDALAAYVMDRGGFESVAQLFEYFLIDAGTEPVVQTSRLRLAISSVQTFIQRCLLNLETQVRPTVIDAEAWQWMKRYRVWEANRKIFLWPENWLEPEFRDDRSHLFRALEGTLLQGDVTADLADDAFHAYLQGLQAIAKLDIVALCVEDRLPAAGSRVLHVVGRTLSTPHNYFYRRVADHMWTPWEPIPLDIKGDHLAAVLWRGRLHLFWVTFALAGDPSKAALPGSSDTTPVVRVSPALLAGTQAPTKAGKEIGIGTGGDRDPELAKVKMSQLKSAVDVTTTVDLNLHWSEYFQGGWTALESSDFDRAFRVSLPSPMFEPSTVWVYASHDGDAVKINLGGAISQGLRVVSKHAPPRQVKPDPAPSALYSADVKGNQDGSRYAPRSPAPLRVTFVEKIETPDGGDPVYTPVTQEILREPRSFALRTTGTPQPGVPGSALGPLAEPFFYQDDVNTFFVEPTVTEVTLEKWGGWAAVGPPPGWRPDRWTDLELQPALPLHQDLRQLEPQWRQQIDPRAKVAPLEERDWLVNPVTAVAFGDRVVVQHGAVEAPLASALDANAAVIGAQGLRPGLLNTIAAERISMLDAPLNPALANRLGNP